MRGPAALLACSHAAAVAWLGNYAGIEALLLPTAGSCRCHNQRPCAWKGLTSPVFLSGRVGVMAVCGRELLARALAGSTNTADSTVPAKIIGLLQQDMAANSCRRARQEQDLVQAGLAVAAWLPSRHITSIK